MRHAVLDLGSNSFHLLLADVDRAGTITKVGSVKEMVRLGAGTLTTGVIDDAAFRRALTSVLRFVEHAGDARLHAVATSAIREARNGPDFVAAVRDKTGVVVEVLTGAEEARLAYLGARSALPDLRGQLGVIDIGGGSIELAVGEHDRCVFSASLPLGVLRLRDVVGGSGRVMAEAVARLIRTRASAAVEGMLAWRPATCVFTSGTARALLAIAGRLRLANRADLRLTRAVAARLAAVLPEMDREELEGLDVPEGRLDTIAPGAVVVSSLLDLLETDALVSPCSLREGVIVRSLRSGSSRPVAVPLSSLG